MNQERDAILSALEQLAWFKESEPEIRRAVAALPAEFSGFLRDLAARPDMVGTTRIVNLARLLPGNYSCTAVFTIERVGGTRHTYEFVGWRHGARSGAKALVVLETSGGEVTHFVVLEGEKFAPARICLEGLGGFVDPGKDDARDIMQSAILREVREELGVPSLALARIPLSLGRLLPDAGMTNNNPELYLLALKYDEHAGLPPVAHATTRELAAKPKLRPIAGLKRMVEESEDAFLIACIARCWARDLLPFA